MGAIKENITDSSKFFLTQVNNLEEITPPQEIVAWEPLSPKHDWVPEFLLQDVQSASDRFTTSKLYSMLKSAISHPSDTKFIPSPPPQRSKPSAKQLTSTSDQLAVSEAEHMLSTIQEKLDALQLAIMKEPKGAFNNNYSLKYVQFPLLFDAQYLVSAPVGKDI